MDTASEYWIAGIAGWITCCVAGVLVGFRREADIEGFFYGCLFGPLGVIMAMRLDKRPRCPWCHTQIDRVFPAPPETSCRKLCPRCFSELKWQFTEAGQSEPQMLDTEAGSLHNAGWFFRLNGLIEGPVSDCILVSLAQKETLPAHTPVRRGLDGNWHTLGDVT